MLIILVLTGEIILVVQKIETANGISLSFVAEYQ